MCGDLPVGSDFPSDRSDYFVIARSKATKQSSFLYGCLIDCLLRDDPSARGAVSRQLIVEDVKAADLVAHALAASP